MSEKKRKASSALEKRPKKKQQTTTGRISIEHVHGDDVAKPVIGSCNRSQKNINTDTITGVTPGVTFPQDIKFQSYSKKTGDGSQALLQSSEHPTIDYVAIEGTESNEGHLKHYVAVYDPATNKLKLTEAKHLTLRGSLRQAQKIDEDEDDEDAAQIPTTSGTRTALTEAFGSKKSKKAVQAMAENRQLAQGIEGATIAEAIAANVKDEDDDEDMVDAAAIARSNKPLPVADLRTDDIEEVYGLSTLIKPQPASTTLSTLPVQSWIARLKAGKEVKVRSRFVANRIGYLGKAHIASPEDQRFLRQLQILYYLEIMIEINQFISKQSRFTRIPWHDKWPENTLSVGTPPRVVGAIMNHIFPEEKPTDRATTLLKSTILALTLHILPPSGQTGTNTLVAEPTDVQLDLAIEAAEARKLYHEIGCVVKPPTEKDLNIWGLAKWARKAEKKDGESGSKQKPMFAVLRFPLNFPKPSTGKRAARR